MCFRWLPFLIFGFTALLLAIVISLFPKKITSKEHSEKSDLKNENELLKLNPDSVAFTPHIIQTAKIKEEEEDSTGSSNNDLMSTPVDEPAQQVFHTHHNGLRDTLELTGSLLSMNKVGFYASHENVTTAGQQETPGGFKTLAKKSLSLFKNPVYVFVVIVATIEGLLQNSFLAFASLFLEYQYRLSSGTSSFIIGLLSIPPLIVGGLLSGYICKRLKNDTIACFKFLVCVLFVNMIVYGGFLIYCQEPTLITSRAGQVGEPKCYETASNCNCDLKIFEPVCLTGSKDIYFQSPCLAGCTSSAASEKQNFYSNCSQSQCESYFEPGMPNTGRFVDGLCPNNSCKSRLVVSFVCIFLLMLLNALLFLPYLKVTIGSVNSVEMNTIVLGLKQFFMNAFGTIPGPILFGSVIDATCSYWHTDSQGQRVCKMYNNQKFALGFGLLGISFKAVCFILISLSLIISIRTRKNLQTSKS